MKTELIVPFQELCKAYKDKPEFQPLLKFIETAFDGIIFDNAKRFDNNDLESEIINIVETNSGLKEIQDCNEEIKSINEDLENLQSSVQKLQSEFQALYNDFRTHENEAE